MHRRALVAVAEGRRSVPAGTVPACWPAIAGCGLASWKIKDLMQKIARNVMVGATLSAGFNLKPQNIKKKNVKKAKKLLEIAFFRFF